MGDPQKQILPNYIGTNADRISNPRKQQTEHPNMLRAIAIDDEPHALEVVRLLSDRVPS